MFREMAKKNKQISNEECIEILKNETRGILSVNGDGGYPYGTPMNHLYNDADGCIYFHCGRQSSHRLDSIARSDKISFCVYEQGYRNEGEWAFNVRSVVIFGRMEVIDDIGEVSAIAGELCRKFTQDEEYIRREIEQHARATLLLKLTPEHICGKKVKEE